jgi:hypothetical protein
VREGEAFAVDRGSELGSLGSKLGGVEDPEAVLRLDIRELLLETAPLVRMSEEAGLMMFGAAPGKPPTSGLSRVAREPHGNPGGNLAELISI